MCVCVCVCVCKVFAPTRERKEFSRPLLQTTSKTAAAVAEILKPVSKSLAAAPGETRRALYQRCPSPTEQADTSRSTENGTCEVEADGTDERPAVRVAKETAMSVTGHGTLSLLC